MRLFGFSVVVDETLSPGEVRFVDRGRIVGRIVNVSDDAYLRCRQCPAVWMCNCNQTTCSGCRWHPQHRKARLDEIEAYRKLSKRERAARASAC